MNLFIGRRSKNWLHLKAPASSMPPCRVAWSALRMALWHSWSVARWRSMRPWRLCWNAWANASRTVATTAWDRRPNYATTWCWAFRWLAYAKQWIWPFAWVWTPKYLVISSIRPLADAGPRRCTTQCLAFAQTHHAIKIMPEVSLQNW